MNTWLVTKRRLNIKGLIFFLGDETIPIGFIKDLIKRQDDWIFEWIAPRFIFVDDPYYRNKVHSTRIPAGEVRKSGSEISDFYFTFRDHNGHKSFVNDLVAKLQAEISELRKKVTEVEGTAIVQESLAQEARTASRKEFGQSVEMLGKMAEVLKTISLAEHPAIKELLKRRPPSVEST
jgi:hypothetical protein